MPASGSLARGRGDWSSSVRQHFRTAVPAQGLVESIQTTLDTTGLDPRNLELELTESIIQNAEATIATLRELE
jgi:EAL domain-containing protein (putative c-di-GMP-specific phosphodiesterase class I)